MAADRSVDPAVAFGDLYSLLYACLAKEMVNTFGKEGENALRRALRKFGAERGRRLRRKHQEMGLELNLKSLFTHGDLPADPRFVRRKVRLTPGARISETHKCPYQEIWREMGAQREGEIYCAEIHHAIWQTYNPEIELYLTRTLTRDDPFCDFKVYLRSAPDVETAGKCETKDKCKADAKCKAEQVKEK